MSATVPRFLLPLLSASIFFHYISGQNPSGFISLDCGIPPNTSYTEQHTNINYESDAAFISTGTIHNISSVYLSNTLKQQLWSLRSFPNGVRNCYRLRVKSGTKYLIRASFLYGNYDDQNKLPGFDLYFGPNLWTSVTLDAKNTTEHLEIMHIVSSNWVEVCLVNTGTGTPFISALELRPLPIFLYETRSESLATFLRLDVGSATNLSYSSKLVVLTGAGISTECGIPDYRSPNGAYSSGFKPITHQEFVRSIRSRRRYWARSYAGWRRFTDAQPGPAHLSLASLEKVGRINLMVTQNVDRLHHRAGSDPLELHGTVYSVICLECGFSICRNSFQDQVKALNPKWAEAIESLDDGVPGSDKSFGMKQRPDGDIEIDEKYWEHDFCIPTCQKCNGVLKPDVVFFGDNVPKDRANKAMEAAKNCDAFLVLGSSVMTMSAYRLVRAAHEAGAATGIVNVGVTRADDFVSMKINARLGEIMPRVLHIGSLSIPSLQ